MPRPVNRVKNNNSKPSKYNKPIRVVPICLGRMGKSHLRILSEDSRFSVVTIVDPKTCETFENVDNTKIPVIPSIAKLNRDAFDCANVATPYKLVRCLIHYIYS